MRMTQEQVDAHQRKHGFGIRNYYCAERGCEEVSTVKDGKYWYCEKHSRPSPNLPAPKPITPGFPTREDFEEIERLARMPIPAPESTVSAPQTPEGTGTAKEWRFTIHGAPVGKPRQTQSDKWKKRPCVMRYRAWADKARASAPKDLPKDPISVSWLAFLPIPNSWSKKKKEAMKGQFHRDKPDIDNLAKCWDALFPQDSCIAQGTLEKRWDDGNGPRIEITVKIL